VGGSDSLPPLLMHRLPLLPLTPPSPPSSSLVRPPWSVPWLRNITGWLLSLEKCSRRASWHPLQVNKIREGGGGWEEDKRGRG
jgi:hypothetical protein